MNIFVNRNQFAELAAYGLVLLLLPVLLGGLQGIQNQFVVGTLVNAVLFVAALRVSSFAKLLPLAILPSIGAYLSAIVFAGDTKFLLFFLPAIWVANLVFIYCTKRNYELVISSFAKAALLFATALALVFLNIVPSAFLIAMGPVQFATALCGGVIGSVVARRRVLK
jgi:hypothetical protein